MPFVPFAPRLSTLFVAASYFLLSAIPLFSLLLGKPVDNVGHVLILEGLGWLGLWALLKRPRWFHYLLLPAFLAIPVEIYLRTYYGQGISTHHLGIIAETSPREALEFLGNKVWWLLVIGLVIWAWWYLALKAAQITSLAWSHWSRWPVALAIGIFAGVWIYGDQVGVTTASNSATVVASGEYAQWRLLPSWAKVPFTDDELGRTWPFGLVLRAVDFGTERRYLSHLAEKSSAFEFKATHPAEDNVAQTIVMVIGESSRFDRWGINGYERDTNPLLKQEANLVSLSDVITAVSATRLSVPIIVSRKPATLSLKAGFAEKSFLSAYKEAGFKTFWISNQMSFGQFDTPTSVFANEADVTQFLNLGDFTNRSNYDQVLLEPFANAIRDTAPKKLIVLHTLGNHWNYSHRYPKEFDKWQPSLFGVVNPAYTNLKNKEALNNSYDNSILYVDWMLSQVISQLKQADQRTALLYFSDHGQTLYDGTCNLAFHGHNTQYEFHIPAFMWYSDQYAEAYPEKIVQLKKHKNARLSTENVFHTLLDVANIRYPDEKLEWSFLSPDLKRHTRYVDSYGWTNYDNATIKGACHEVIDKKTPLSQEK